MIFRLDSNVVRPGKDVMYFHPNKEISTFLKLITLDNAIKYRNTYLGERDLNDKEAGLWSKALRQNERSRKIYTIGAKMHLNP